jgi:hypothetical protein
MRAGIDRGNGDRRGRPKTDPGAIVALRKAAPAAH